MKPHSWQEYKNSNRNLFIKQTREAPRLTSMLSSFESISQGLSQSPKEYPKIKEKYLDVHPDFKKHNEIFEKNIGTFFKHALSSIPYRRENEMRVDIALKKFSEQYESPITFWGISSADGTRERTLSEFTNGNIITLTDSPNKWNEVEFNRLLTHYNSFFHHGCWVDIDPNFLKNNPYSSHFRDGFDIIWECCAFQMYGNNRSDQMRFISESLKPNGLVFLYEKMNAPNQEDFVRMEKLKTEFKKQYFTDFDIKQKESSILKTMHTWCVTLDKLIEDAKWIFKHGALIWSAGNFYEVVVSNSKNSLLSFLDSLPSAFVPNDYTLEKQQVRLLFSDGKTINNSSL